MPARRFIGLLAVLGAVAAFAADPAAAARPPFGLGTAYPETLTTEHFQIHYTGVISTPANPDRIIHQQAGDLAATAERAYDLFVNKWGYPAPKSDGDGKVDIWVQKQAEGQPTIVASPDTGPPSSVWISIDPSKVTDRHVGGWLTMTAIQAGIWYAADNWLLYATSEWGGFAADEYANVAGSLPAPDMSVDCDSQACGNVSYEFQGQSRWLFFQYLSERYGVSFVKSIFEAGKKANDPTKKSRELLISALAEKGATLGTVFNDYTAAHVASAYNVTALKETAPTTYASIAIGKKTTTFSAIKVAVNHLAARYVKLARDTTASTDCFSATLSLTVTLPAGSTSKPTFFAKATGVKPLTVSGNTASVSVPWDTCATGSDGYLALPNPSLTADAQDFTVSGSLTVSTTSLIGVQPSPPPPAAYAGSSVNAPTTEGAPSIIVHGAEVVRVLATTRLLRLLVLSHGNGQLQVKLGEVLLGTVQLRAGNNDIRFVLPETTAAALRGTASTVRTPANTLALTSLSPQSVAGDTVLRTVVVVNPAPAKKKKTASRR